MLPLTGIRILDLSRLLPGPYCTMLLADLGCEVIKIEEPHLGDYLRWVPPFIGEESSMFLAVNRNKQSMTLNLKSQKGKSIFFKMIEQADVVVESFRPGTLKTLGIHYEESRKVNPGIIYCSITAYGQQGPYKSRAAHDINIIGLGGFLGLTGGREIPGIQIADTSSALMSCIAILVALIMRDKTGQGQHIDISMLDSIVSLLALHISEYIAINISSEQEKVSLSGEMACYNVYETQDGKLITLGAVEPKFWEQFCESIGKPELKNKQFSRDQGLLKTCIGDIIRQKTQKEWLEILLDVCTPVNSIGDLLKDPQILSRDIISAINHPTAGTILQVRHPMKFSSDLDEMREHPPLFGEHTIPLLRELGYSDEDITHMKEADII